MLKKIVGVMLFIFLATLVYQSVSAYEIYCLDGDSGMRIWERGEVTDEKREVIGNLLDNEIFVNCTLMMNETENEFEKCQQFFDPVINVLNKNIRIRNEKLRRGRHVNYGFIALIGLMLIISIIKNKHRRKN